MNPAYKRMTIAGLLILIGLTIALMFSYEVIKINWISFMMKQPAFQPMYDPLPVVTDTVPIEGAAYTLVLGVEPNPVTADQASLTRGAELYQIDCALCHGNDGKANGPMAPHLKNKPYDLTSLPIQSFTDGGIFYVISTGVPEKMPALNENLTVLERWDVVNYVRTLK